MTKALQVKASKSSSSQRAAARQPATAPTQKNLRGGHIAQNPVPRKRPAIKPKPATPIRATDAIGKQAIERISKQATLISLLSQKDGTTLSAMMSTTGWQAHSVRGVLSGVLRKKLGFNVAQAKDEQGERIYRIVS